MTLTIAILLCVLGIALLFIEIMFVPGVGIVGVFGFIAMGIGIYGSYTIGDVEGHSTLTGCLICSAGLAYLAFQPSTWKRVSVNTNITGRVNTLTNEDVKVGDQGKSVTRINPIGNAIFNDKIFEVQSQNEFIDENQTIEVIKINRSQIIVTSI